MAFLKSKTFWLSVLHISIIAGGAVGTAFLGPAAGAAAGALNAVIPSPLSTPKPISAQ